MMMQSNVIADALHQSTVDLATTTAQWSARDIVNSVQHHDLADKVAILQGAVDVLQNEIRRLKPGACNDQNP